MVAQRLLVPSVRVRILSREIGMVMHKEKTVDYKDLYEFLKTPKTAVELKKKYNCRRHKVYGIITSATFLMPLYEFTNEEGMICYGLMEE